MTKTKIVLRKLTREAVYEALHVMRMGAWVQPLKYQFEHNIEFANYSFEDRTASIVYEAREQFLNRQVARLIERGTGGRKPLGATAEGISFDPQRSLNREVVKSLLDLDWVMGEPPRYVTITGLSGTGKTYLMEVVIRQACLRSLKVAYYDFSSFSKLTEDARTDTDLDRVFNTLNRKDLIIIDDFGLFPCAEGAVKLLFRLVDRRMGNGALLIGSQYKLEDWYAYFAGEESDKGVADAMMGRLRSNSIQIELQGPSLRDKYGLNTQWKNKEDK